MRRLWCRIFHSRTSWPVNGKYECFDCGLIWPVRWHPPTETSTAAPARTTTSTCDGILDGAGVPTC